MAKRKRRRRRSKTIPLAPIIGLFAAPDMATAITKAAAGDYNTALAYAKQIIGIDSSNNFSQGLLARNITPMIIGVLVHKFIGGWPLNLNRTLARSGVPYVRI